MSEHPFQKFIDLIQFDQANLAIEKTIAKLQQEIHELKIQEEKLSKEFQESKNSADQARKEVERLELEMKTLDNAEKNNKNRLENSTDYKQYQSLKAEIESLKRKQHENEELLMGVWNRLEVAEKDMEKLKIEHAQKLSELEKSIAAKDQEIATRLNDLDENIKKRPARLEGVPEEWLDKYAMMKSKVPDPVVPVVRGSCGACFQNITEHELMQLRRRKLLQCKGCYRLLYSTEIEQQASS